MVQCYYPPKILKGFKNFCQDCGFKYIIINDIVDEPINKDEVFISVKKGCLVCVVEKKLLANLKIGVQVGIISYNEVAIKQITLNGIITFSTDFSQMQKITAELIFFQFKIAHRWHFKFTLKALL